MKATGRVIVCGIREALKYCSTFAFDSKCGMPVFRVRRGDARQDDVRPRCGFRGIDCRRALLDLSLRVPEKSGPNGVVTTKKPSTFRNAGGEACALREVTLSAFDSCGGEGFQLRGASREADDSMPSLEEAASDRPSLLSRRSRHQDRLRLCHPQSPRGPKTSVLLVDSTSLGRVSGARMPENLRYRTSGLAVTRTTLGWGFVHGRCAPFSGGTDE